MPGDLIQGNTLHMPLKDKSVQLCCFSPPYWGLRSYKIRGVQFPDGYRGQLGFEPTIDLFLNHLMLVMNEVWRVLRDDGVVFVNLGDSYAGSGGAHKEHHKNPGLSKSFDRDGVSHSDIKRRADIEPKSLCLIPQKFAICCQEAGWIIRSEIIWYKSNPMPESCKDRPTKAHEQIWMLTKQGKYFWDQEAVKERTHRDIKVGWKDSDLKKYSCDSRLEEQGTYKDWRKYCPTGIVEKRNIRSVWPLATEPTPEAHFATWPSKLVEIMVKAGSSPKACEFCGAPWKRVLKKTFTPQEDVSLKKGVRGHLGQKPMDKSNNWGGFPRGTICSKTIAWQPTCRCKNHGIGRCVVLDPFVGIGTTVLKAEEFGRKGVGIDLSWEYLTIALKKTRMPILRKLSLL